MSFTTNGYEVIPNLVTPDIAKLFNAYALFSEMQHPERIINDNQITNAYALYGDPLAEALLLHCHKSVETTTHKTVTPTYSYYRVYRSGAELKPHKDRPACEISISLCLGYDYAGADITYPLYVENNAIELLPGDALLYAGTEREHSRKIFEAPKNAYHVQAFLHYVDVDGPHADEAYDSRVFIGYPRHRTIPFPHHDNMTKAARDLCS